MDTVNIEEAQLLKYLLEEEGIELLVAPTIPRRADGQAPPLSFAQERLWFLNQLEPESTAYNISSALRLSGPLDVPALQRSFTALANRHEALRTTFEVRQGQPFQIIAPAAAVPVPVVDLRQLPAALREQEAVRQIQAAARQPFDLTRGPLLRTLLVRLDDTEHVLLLALHHTISDGWSMNVLVRELKAGYLAAVTRRAPNLPELPIQYADYACWQRQELQGETLEDELSYWTGQLAGAPAVLALPLDRPRPPVRTDNGALHGFELAPGTLAELARLAQDEGATLFMTLLAAFQVLLARSTRQDDIVVGSPVANRTQVETEDLIGCFVNMLALRTDLAGNPTFRTLLRRVREVTLSAYTHQDLPFEKIVETLQLERDLSYTPLFQVVFQLVEGSARGLELPGLTVSDFQFEGVSSKFDLCLELNIGPGRSEGYILYNPDLFDAGTIARMSGHFRALLDSISADPDRPILDLALVDAGERQLLLDVWGATGAAFEQGRCLHTLFEQQVARTPDAVALVFEETHLTYAELNRRANRLARHLQSKGVGPEVLVGLYQERSLDLVVGLLGILKAGGAYVPLDPAYPPERLAFMLADAEVAALVTHSALAADLPALDRPLVCLDTLDATHPDLGSDNLCVDVAPDHLAYVIYTSGSTGTPKGALVSHANVTRLFAATQEWFHFDERDVWSLFHSAAFDFSVWEIWGALLHGGRLVVVPYLVSRSPDAFYNLVRAEQVTVLNQTPSAFYQFSRIDAAVQASDLRLRLVIFGGEALELSRLRAWFERRGDRQPLLVNMYGITETTVHVTYRPLSMQDLTSGRGSVIGRPIPDLSLYVLDSARQPVPFGVPGELYVGGAGVARGYLNRPALTDERFVPNPFGDEGRRTKDESRAADGSILNSQCSMLNSRLYKTGDLVRMLPDGELVYLGRIDQQVKVRGFRIELGEIELALGQHPEVREAVVVARSLGGDETRLVAYVAPVSGASPSVNALRGFLQATLPDYMVPTSFVFLEAFPMTPSGKLDRAALPAPDQSRPALEETYVAPRNAVEAALAEAWAEVLRIERVGIHDNFFALGGDSIRSVQVLARARERGLYFSLQQLFRTQTIAEIAQVLEIKVSAETAVRTSPFSLVSAADRQQLPADVEDAYPLTLLQAGMFYHMELAPGVLDYHNVNSSHIRCPYDIERFREAVRLVVARHPVLRTSFDLMNYSDPIQLVHSTACADIQEEDIRHLAPEQQEQLIRAFIDREARRPFDLARPPLIRFSFHRRTDETFQFSFAECHPILDGWSLSMVLSELFTLYFALIDTGAAPETPALSSSFRDFVALEQMALRSERHQRYWADKLRDAAVLRLPRRPETDQGTAGQRIRGMPVAIGPELSDGLRQLATLAAVPVRTVLLAAHLRVMSLLGGQADVLTGVVSHGRMEERDGERVAGLFLNSLPFRLQLAGGSWLDLLRATFEVECEMLPFRQYPLAAIQQQRGTREPLFEALFNYTNYHINSDLQKSRRMEFLGTGVEWSPSNILLQVGFSADATSSQLSLRLDYHTDTLCYEQVEAIGSYYVNALAAMVSDPTACYATADLLSDQERHELLVARNTTAAPYPADVCYHHLVAAQVVRTPQALAVRDGRSRLSYAQLDTRANQLARLLLQRGVGAGSCVALLMERSCELLVAVLAVLKAGAAFLPLDRAFPPERIAFMLDDAQVPLALTHTALADRLPAGAAVLCLDQLGSLLDTLPATPPSSPVTAAHRAYLIYTSGSTGRPKGVPVPHRGLVNYLHWAIDAYTAAAGSGAPVQSSIAADAIFPSLFTPLLVGGSILLLPEEDALGALALALDPAQPFSLIKITPTQLEVLSAQLTPEQVAGSVHTLVVGAEALRGDTLAFWQLHAPHTRLLNEYGPTETVVGCSAYVVPPGRTIHGPVPIGLPIANTQFYVLDRHMQPVPVGVVGELYIGGDGVAYGYHNRPEQTAAAFVPDPFSSTPGARLYKTGDQVRYLADPEANIEFLGRADEQVKIRGYRVELGEVEAVLASHPLVAEVAVLARNDDGRDTRLVAYVVGSEGQAPGAEELRAFARQRLPEYMLPAAVVGLEQLPLTTTGKLDRRALPAPEQVRPEQAETYVAPRTAAEELLAGIWADVLGLDRVGVHDNFFTLGGDSLLSLRVITRARKAGVHIRPIHLLQSPTIAELAALAQEASALVIDQGPVSGPVPLTPPQHWLLEKSGLPDHQFYNASIFEVAPDFNPEQLREALQHVVTHHDMLRARFWRGTDGWRQQIAPPSSEVPFLSFDLSELSEAEQRGRIEQIGRRLHGNPELAAGPLRLVYFKLGADRPGRLALLLHHLVTDGMSTAILLEDLVTAYQQLDQQQPVQLPSKTTSFKQWAERIHEYAQSPAIEREFDYWRGLPWERLSPLPLDFPENRQRTDYAAQRVAFMELSAAETTALLDKLRADGSLQIQELLLAAYAYAVAQWADRDTIQIMVIGHARYPVFDDIDLSRTLGWMTTGTPMVLTVAKERPFAEEVRSLNAQYQAVPLHGIGHGVLENFSPYAKQAMALREPYPVEVQFNYNGQFFSDLSAPQSWLRDYSDEQIKQTEGMKILPSAGLLGWEGQIRDGRLGAEWAYNESWLEHSTVERIMHAFRSALRSFVDDPPPGGGTAADPAGGFLTAAQTPTSARDLAPADQGLVTGPVPLTPGQFDFFADKGFLKRDHWNSAGLYEVPAGMNRRWLEQAVGHLMLHHDALRARFVSEQHAWRQHIAGAEDRAPFRYIDLSGLAAEDHPAAIEAAANQLQTSLNITDGPLLQVALFDLGSDRPARLLLIVHHLVSDGVAMTILLEDLLTAYTQLSGGQPVRLPDKTTSVKQWAEALSAHYSQPAVLHQELEYWRSLPWEAAPPLPTDYPAQASLNTKASIEEHTVSLSVQETNTLLQGLPKLYKTQIRDVLLMALTQTITQWSGSPWLRVRLIDSLRSMPIPGFSDLDLSRTVGNLVIFDLLMLHWRAAGSAGEELIAFRDQLRQIPNWGRGYALLQNFGGELARALPTIAFDLPIGFDLIFNYLGQIDLMTDETISVRDAHESYGLTESPEKDLFWCLISCNTFVIDGHLIASWRYSRNLYRRDTIEAVAGGFIKALQTLLRHAEQAQEAR